MSIQLSKLLNMIQAEAKKVNTQLSAMKSCGTSISIVAMIQLQMTMNKFSQISDLGSTTISLFNQAFKTAITNVLR